MGILRSCNDYDHAAEILGIVAEYIELPHNVKHPVYCAPPGAVETWVIENLDGLVVYIIEEEFQKSYITFLFQYSEDAIAFKLYWL